MWDTKHALALNWMHPNVCAQKESIASQPLSDEHCQIVNDFKTITQTFVLDHCSWFNSSNKHLEPTKHWKLLLEAQLAGSLIQMQKVCSHAHVGLHKHNGILLQKVEIWIKLHIFKQTK